MNIAMRGLTAIVICGAALSSIGCFGPPRRAHGGPYAGPPPGPPPALQGLPARVADLERRVEALERYHPPVVPRTEKPEGAD